MALIKWESNLILGIDVIDKQHRRLIDLINDFYENYNKNESKEKLILLIKGMKEYTIYHFLEEEKLLKSYGYPFLESHQQLHKGYNQTVLGLEEKVTSGKMLVSFEVTNYLKNWITEHILKEDTKYAVYLKEKGAR
jgi:hemerythrin-like metal-binding protein